MQNYLYNIIINNNLFYTNVIDISLNIAKRSMDRNLIQELHHQTYTIIDYLPTIFLYTPVEAV